jgi:Transcriptional regulator
MRLSKFFNLDPEKQQRILNAAIKEFTQKRFKNASTNEMVKEADISKGLLFHYFDNKKNLFLFLYDYAIKVLSQEYFGKIDLHEKDLFCRLQQMTYFKIELIKKYSDLFRFMKTANLESSDEIRNELEQRNKAFIANDNHSIYELENIDVSRFKENIDIPKAINIIIWTMEGLSNQIEEKNVHSIDELNFDEILGKVDIYLGFLKGCFYK